jgi:ABC-type sugar transport system ATPase subunit
VPLVVEAVESLGHEVVLHGRAGPDVLVAKLHATRAPAIGSQVEVYLELDALHLFDPETERRLEQTEPPAGSSA